MKCIRGDATEKEVQRMGKEKTKTEILKILTRQTKDLPRKKRYLYFLAHSLFFYVQYMIVIYMAFFLSQESPSFGILALVYCSVLIALILIANKEMEKLDQRSELVV